MQIKSIKTKDFDFTIEKPVVVFYPKEYEDKNNVDGRFPGYKKLSLCFKLFATLFGKDLFLDKKIFCYDDIGDIELEYVDNDNKTHKIVVDNEGNNTPFVYESYEANKNVFFINPYDLARYTGEYGHEFYKAESKVFDLRSHCIHINLRNPVDQLVIDVQSLCDYDNGDWVWESYNMSSCHNFYLFAMSREQALYYGTGSAQFIEV